MAQCKKNQDGVQPAHHQPSSITGRDGYIMMQALVYASEWLKTLPVHQDEPSNRNDMDAILADMSSSSFTKMLRWQAQCKLANKTWESSDQMIAEMNAFMKEDA
jgi:hypothetical protein